MFSVTLALHGSFQELAPGEITYLDKEGLWVVGCYRCGQPAALVDHEVYVHKNFVVSVAPSLVCNTTNCKAHYFVRYGQVSEDYHTINEHGLVCNNRGELVLYRADDVPMPFFKGYRHVNGEEVGFIVFADRSIHHKPKAEPTGIDGFQVASLPASKAMPNYHTKSLCLVAPPTKEERYLTNMAKTHKDHLG